jgi:hypothetical protein
MNASELENVLRLAPRPTPPTGLKDQLIAQLRLPAGRPAAQTPAETLAAAGWLRRWWPVLAPATVSLACAVVLAAQQMEIRDLRATLRGLSQGPAATEPARPASEAGTDADQSAAEASAKVQAEIARLKALATQLAAEIAQLEQMSAENQKLRAQAAALAAGYLTPEEAEQLAKAKEKALAIMCSNNMKQLCLADRVWAIDNGDVSPPDILSMTNEMGTPKILVCPSDTGRQVAKDWASYTSANCSYEYLAPSARSGEDMEPQRVAFRCPIHGTVGLCDGSVQMGIAKKHPERLVQRNGKLYLEDEPPPQVTPAAPGGSASPDSQP